MEINPLPLSSLNVRSWVGVFILFLSTSICFGQNSNSERFDYVLHDNLEDDDIVDLVRALEENYERIKTNLRVDSLPLITVQFWADEEAYQDVMETAFGMRFPGSRGYVYGERELRVLLLDGVTSEREVVHEFVHAVTLNLNPAFGNNPRWLWEAVAQYEAGEFREPRDISYLREGNYPGLSELNQGFNTGRNIYDVGFVLTEYIVETWGRKKLIALIQANGDLETALGVDEAGFEAGWHQFLKETYFSLQN